MIDQVEALMAKVSLHRHRGRAKSHFLVYRLVL
jgi:hypothetical protein